VDFYYSNDFEGATAPAQEGSTLFVQEQLAPTVEVGDEDVNQNFSTSSIQLETVEGIVSNLNSLPAELLENEVILGFTSKNETIAAFTTLQRSGDTGAYSLELPDNREYVANLQLFEDDELMNTVQIAAIYGLGSVNLTGSSSSLSIGAANLTADFEVPATATLSGTLSETGESDVPEGSSVIAQDTGVTNSSDFFFGLAGGVSSALTLPSGNYQLTLVSNRQYDLFGVLTLDDNRIWGLPSQLGTNVIDFNGPATRDITFPVRPTEVTLTGQVTGPVLTATTENEGVANVDVSVTCWSLSGAPDTFFSGSTQTDSSGNYSLQVLSGSDCEIEFQPVLVSGFPF
jgi:hypothetical protein